MSDKELIAEARHALSKPQLGRNVYSIATEALLILRRTTDALEAAEAELRDMLRVDIPSLKAERDAATEALAKSDAAFRALKLSTAKADSERIEMQRALDRVRAVLAKERAWHEHLVESGDAVPRNVIGIGKVESALDGAPEPEDVWEYQWGEPGESFEGFDSFATEELALAEMELDSDYPSHRVMRRRKAGPWVRVESEEK